MSSSRIPVERKKSSYYMGKNIHYDLLGTDPLNLSIPLVSWLFCLSYRVYIK